VFGSPGPCNPLCSSPPKLRGVCRTSAGQRAGCGLRDIMRAGRANVGLNEAAEPRRLLWGSQRLCFCVASRHGSGGWIPGEGSSWIQADAEAMRRRSGRLGRAGDCAQPCCGQGYRQATCPGPRANTEAGVRWKDHEVSWYVCLRVGPADRGRMTRGSGRH